ncbi:MAG: hypothetical protein NZ761_04365, partial [Dehalococcoidia bacterium]|nr:hypothetical protein [Dehalococcoidia bacterium]
AARAARAGWPGLALAAWCRVREGEAAWQRFLERATAEQVQQALDALAAQETPLPPGQGRSDGQQPDRPPEG